VGNKRRQGNMTLENNNNHPIKDLVGSQMDESSVAVARKIMIGMFEGIKEEIKEDIQKQFNESHENSDTKLKKTQKQINGLKENFNKLGNETKEII
jgi:hypothetical protein